VTKINDPHLSTLHMQGNNDLMYARFLRPVNWACVISVHNSGNFESLVNLKNK